MEFVHLFHTLRSNPAQEHALRQAGQRTALHYAWPQIIHRLLLPRLQLMAQAFLPPALRQARQQVYAA
jgi:hypothetical protein